MKKMKLIVTLLRNAFRVFRLSQYDLDTLKKVCDFLEIDYDGKGNNE
jgi:hypothetical protein